MSMWILTLAIGVPLWAYIIVAAAETGHNQGWEKPIEEYSNYNIFKWIIIAKRKVFKK